MRQWWCDLRLWLKEVVAGWESVWLGKPRCLGCVDPAKFVIDVGQSASQAVKFGIAFLITSAHKFCNGSASGYRLAAEDPPRMNLAVF